MIERVKLKRYRPSYKIGYRHPPKETQFKPGKSGNPKGRPKGARSPAAILRAIIEKRVPVTENGRTRRISVLEVAFLRLAQDAMRANSKAISLLLSLITRYGEAPETGPQVDELLAEDKEILSHYLQQSLNASRVRGSKSDRKDR